MGAFALGGTKEQLAFGRPGCYNAHMAKLDPLIHEFETEEEAAAYDKWFRAQVEEGLRSTSPTIPHAEAMARIRATLDKYRNA
jgi:hypothetical protein